MSSLVELLALTVTRLGDGLVSLVYSQHVIGLISWASIGGLPVTV